MAFGQDSTELLHVRPFGCRMLYHPVTARLPPFKPRLLEGVCLGHSGGGVYKVLKADKVVLTKHVRAFEDEFPGTELIRPGDKNAENWQPPGRTLSIVRLTPMMEVSLSFLHLTLSRIVTVMTKTVATTMNRTISSRIIHHSQVR